MNFTEFRLLLKSRNFAFWKEAHRAAELSADEIEQLSLERTLALFRHAYKNIPFYHEKYSAAGITSEFDIKSWEDFQKLPILEKEEIRTQYKSMIAKDDSLASLKKIATGGSTGEPLQVWQSPGNMEMLLWPILEKTGISYCDPFGSVGRGTCSPLHMKLTNLLFYPRRYCNLDACEVLSPEKMKVFAQDLKKIKAKYIRGYVGGIQQFAGYCEAENLKFPELKAVWTSSAPLPENIRNYMSKFFGCPVYTQYGCCEIPSLAMECPSQCGMHLLPYARKIEIVDADGNNAAYDQTGDVVITNLLEYRFPLLRYRNGDRAALLDEKCSCGSSLPLLGYVMGRSTDCLHFKDKSSIAGDYLTTIFDDYPNAVKAFQFFQAKDGNVSLRIVKNNSYSACDKEIELVSKKMEKLFAGKADFQVQEVAEIPHDKGKTRYILRES